jgi:hypothetical protein
MRCSRAFRGWRIDFVAASLDPVRTERGLPILPTKTPETALASDLVGIVGGGGIERCLSNDVPEGKPIAFSRQPALKQQTTP